MMLAEYLLLVLLVLVSYSTYRAKERYFYKSKDSYNKLMFGMLSWSLLLLVRVLGESGALQQVWALHHVEYRYLLEALLAVGGGLFLSLGVTEWLVRLTAVDLKSSQYQKRLDLLSAVAAASRVKQELSQYLNELRNLLTHYTNAEAVSFYHHDESAGGFVPTEPHSIPLTEGSILRQWCQTVIQSRRLSLVSHETGEDHRPTVVLPMQMAIAQPLAMAISWESGARVDAGLLQLLELLTLQFGTAVSVGMSSAGDNEKALVVLQKLQHDLAAVDRIPDAMHLIDDALHRIVAYDILRIAVFDSRGFNVTQYCLGRGKNLLTERNRSISTQKTNLGSLFQSPQVICSDALAQSDLDDDRWLSSLSAQHALTIPVLSGAKAVAAVTLAAETTGFDKIFGEKIAMSLSAALLPLVRSDSFTHQLVAYNRQLLDLTGTLKKLVSSDDTTAFLSELADTVVKKLPATYCRFWRYNSDQETLEFIADSQSRDVSNHVTDTRILSLPQARWHKLTIQAGRMMLINQREERMQMDDQELVQSLVVGMQSALLAPMMAGNRAIGIMAVAEMRNWDRRNFSHSDSLFARGIANIAAQALLSAASAEHIERLSRHLDRLQQGKLLGEVFSDLPKRLATPLTSIMARTQQLIDCAREPDEQTSRNLSIIKMQTEKIMNDVRTLQEVRREQALQRQL